MELKNIFAENLKIQLARANKTAAQMSEDLRIPKTTISNWTTGKTYPRIDTLEQIANYLNCRCVDLMDDPEKSSMAAGSVLASIYNDKELLLHMKRILRMSEDKKKKIYSFIDFIESTDE